MLQAFHSSSCNSKQDQNKRKNACFLMVPYDGTMKKLTICQFMPLGLMLVGLAAGLDRASASVPVFNDATDPTHVSADYKFSGLDRNVYTTYPGSLPGTANWPSPISANGGVTSVTLNRPSGGGSTDFLHDADGNGGIYSFMSNTNYMVTQTSPLSSLSSITFQLYMAQGSDPGATSNFYFGTPTLTLSLVGGGTATPTLGTPSLSAGTTGSSAFGPTTLKNLTLNWDVSGVSTPVASYTVSFQTAQHAIAYGMDLTEVSTQVVPEPSTWALLVAGFAGLLYFGHRRRGSAIVG